jgi:hypothetical protein
LWEFQGFNRAVDSTICLQKIDELLTRTDGTTIMPFAKIRNLVATLETTQRPRKPTKLPRFRLPLDELDGSNSADDELSTASPAAVESGSQTPGPPLTEPIRQEEPTLITSLPQADIPVSAPSEVPVEAQAVLTPKEVEPKDNTQVADEGSSTTQDEVAKTPQTQAAPNPARRRKSQELPKPTPKKRPARKPYPKTSKTAEEDKRVETKATQDPTPQHKKPLKKPEVQTQRKRVQKKEKKASEVSIPTKKKSSKKESLEVSTQKKNNRSKKDTQVSARVKHRQKDKGKSQPERAKATESRPKDVPKQKKRRLSTEKPKQTQSSKQRPPKQRPEEKEQKDTQATKKRRKMSKNDTQTRTSKPEQVLEGTSDMKIQLDILPAAGPLAPTSLEVQRVLRFLPSREAEPVQSLAVTKLTTTPLHRRRSTSRSRGSPLSALKFVLLDSTLDSQTSMEQ